MVAGDGCGGAGFGFLAGGDMNEMNEWVSFGVVSVKNAEGEIKQHRVHLDVMNYILQLESFVRDPEVSKVKELYPERFDKIDVFVSSDPDAINFRYLNPHLFTKEEKADE